MPKKRKRDELDELYLQWLGIQLLKLRRGIDQIYENLGLQGFSHDHEIRLGILVKWSTRYREKNLEKNSGH